MKSKLLLGLVSLAGMVGCNSCVDPLCVVNEGSFACLGEYNGHESFYIEKQNKKSTLCAVTITYSDTYKLDLVDVGCEGHVDACVERVNDNTFDIPRSYSEKRFEDEIDPLFREIKNALIGGRKI